MRRLMVVLCSLIAFAAVAQERRFVQRRPPEWRGVVTEYEERMRFLSKSVARDAFIVSQMMQAVRELHDFQKLIAVEKALDRINASIQRATEDPAASLQTLTALNSLQETFKHAREQGTMADAEALQKEILEQTHFIQRELFRELDVAREERKNLAELIGKLHQVNADLESAMIDALGSTFDFVKAGGD